jgi:hypothetical protein
MGKRYLVIGVCLSLVIFGCSIASGAGSNEPKVTPTTSNVLFQDDFSDQDSGWNTSSDELGSVEYEDGGFRFFVNEVQFDYWSVPDLNFSDVHIEVDGKKAGGPDDNDFGVICRYQDEKNFYAFLISSDGYYGISKMKEGEHNVIGTDGMQYSDLILPGAATNRIGADCIGSRLVLYVNGEELLQIEDSEFTDGDIGLLAGTFDSPGVDIVFDNLVVTRTE